MIEALAPRSTSEFQRAFSDTGALVGRHADVSTGETGSGEEADDGEVPLLHTNSMPITDRPRVNSDEPADDPGMASLNLWGPGMSSIRAAMAAAVSAAHAPDTHTPDTCVPAAAAAAASAVQAKEQQEAGANSDGASTASTVGSPRPRSVTSRLAGLRDPEHDLSFKVTLRSLPGAGPLSMAAQQHARSATMDSRDGSAAGGPGFSFAETVHSMPSTATLWSVGECPLPRPQVPSRCAGSTHSVLPTSHAVHETPCHVVHLASDGWGAEECSGCIMDAV